MIADAIGKVKMFIIHTRLYDFLRPIQYVIDLREWCHGRLDSSTHLVQRQVVKEYAKRFNIKILIESGTYFGDMVFAMRNSFAGIYSIELDEYLYRRAKRRFQNYPHISIVQGDSGAALPGLLVGVKEPALFWLDGHYSAGVTAKGEVETPIIKEIEAILAHPVQGHVILIDDARCFKGANDYPTVGALRSLIQGRRPGWQFYVAGDIIRVHH